METSDEVWNFAALSMNGVPSHASNDMSLSFYYLLRISFLNPFEVLFMALLLFQNHGGYNQSYCSSPYLSAAPKISSVILDCHNGGFAYDWDQTDGLL